MDRATIDIATNVVLAEVDPVSGVIKALSLMHRLPDQPDPKINAPMSPMGKP